MERFSSDPDEKFGWKFKVQINERGDKAIVIFAKGEQIVVNQYNLDFKEKKLKKEKELKVIVYEDTTSINDKIKYKIFHDLS